MGQPIKVTTTTTPTTTNNYFYNNNNDKNNNNNNNNNTRDHLPTITRTTPAENQSAFGWGENQKRTPFINEEYNNNNNNKNHDDCPTRKFYATTLTTITTPSLSPQPI